MQSSQSLSARVLPFVPSPITPSLEEQVAQIRAVDPEGAETLERYVYAVYRLRVKYGPHK